MANDKKSTIDPEVQAELDKIWAEISKMWVSINKNWDRVKAKQHE